MTGERPDDAQRPEDTDGPADGTDGLEARRASDADAPFRGLRSAADIFGAPRSADEWPSRRERREAFKAAQETGAPLPEPFAAPVDEDAEPSAAPASDDAPAQQPADDATQAISMPEELSAPSQHAHPSSIQLPTAQSTRDARAAEARAIDEERRRTDPTGTGRTDVDWLGRANGTDTDAVTVGEPVPRQPLGVEGALPPADEPPSFTDLLRVAPDDGAGVPGPGRPFDWAVHDDATGEVPTTLTSDAYDTTALAGGSWSLADETDDDVVTGEVPTPSSGVPAAQALDLPPAPAALPVDDGAPAVGGAPDAGAAAAATGAAAAGATGDDGLADPAPTAAWSLADEAEATPTVAFEPPRAASGTPWWAEPDDSVPPTAAPPLVEPAPTEYPAHLPPSVGQDFDAVLGGSADREPEHDADDGPGATTSRPDPEDIDQSEWSGRETSDTSAIKDLFGTAAVDQLGSSGYDPHDTGTAMMPAVGRATEPRAAAGASAAGGSAARASDATPADRAPGQQGVINQQFARLQSEGKRGKQLLFGGAVVLIVVMLVAVFLLARWIMGNTVSDHLTSPSASSTAAAQSAAPSEQASSTPAAAAPTAAAGLQFATTQATPGEHAWTDLAGGECLSPYTNAWAQTFTVVDCQTPHLAQLTARIQVQAGAWPGPDALAAQASEQCQTSAALNTSAAAAYGDVQVQGSYAPDQETWDRGDTYISCFATRSSGQTMTGSLAPAQ
ncbi:hypothetical protein Csp2054_13790 [Curtobacterium sp. 'Ferrero']|uniref:septum formation family protein n=1 Tax=Curtobacterium sp. 'Ferrero' TaxID=2033654 RepID=UPI000BD90101|nr:septum formation family protein [Curtobacterium sp. 'Ferrero']PCN47053.1 hypothetical protein Csp2054_13790 [Curtobacterium sp. 'Ferrero']